MHDKNQTFGLAWLSFELLSESNDFFSNSQCAAIVSKDLDEAYRRQALALCTYNDSVLT